MRSKLTEDHQENTYELSTLINTYGNAHANYKHFEGETKRWSKELKDYMQTNKLDQRSTDSYSVSVSIAEKAQVDEDKLIELLLANGGIAVKQKYYVDFDELEHYLYNTGDKNIATILQQCTSLKQIPTLRIKEKK